MERWPPTAADDKNKCGNCGEQVSEDFRRVYGVNGRVNACPECSTYRVIKETAGGHR